MPIRWNIGSQVIRQLVRNGKLCYQHSMRVRYFLPSLSHPSTTVALIYNETVLYIQ